MQRRHEHEENTQSRKKDRPSQAAKSPDTIHRSDGHRTGRAPWRFGCSGNFPATRHPVKEHRTRRTRRRTSQLDAERSAKARDTSTPFAFGWVAPCPLALGRLRALLGNDATLFDIALVEGPLAIQVGSREAKRTGEGRTCWRTLGETLSGYSNSRAKGSSVCTRKSARIVTVSIAETITDARAPSESNDAALLWRWAGRTEWVGKQPDGA